ncbi:ABC transporter permease [Alkalibacter mobilis]|uniref:ABC transporter permease n=1 Tax=Alkalibacter mobilis TaxID=2787712 RepID=UPI00189E6698|nr:ABC transporter permease [Alkalibacter mobilis]MBF7095654.1 ABC transporter permease [Alkalibacter mobilis]
MNVLTILWHEQKIFKQKFWTITSSSMISPLLYLIAFGWGLGSEVIISGTSYMNFVMPGIVAMTTMTVSFGTVANSLNISRTYDKTFEEFMTSPIRIWEYAIGKITAGALRGMYSAVLIIIIALFFKANIIVTGFFVLVAFLNALVFSSLGFVVGMVIDSHLEMSKFTSFIITPMAFLSGTFFPIEKMPFILNELIRILPLTQSTIGMRTGTPLSQNAWISPSILITYFLLFLFLSIRLCKRAE